VGGIKRVGDFDSQFEHLLKRQWLAGNAVLQRLAVQKFQGDKAV
jgi:hypothetical protein